MGPAMATMVTVTLEDDLDGGPAAETVRFEVGGTADEIDLNKNNARAFRKQLAPLAEHAARTAPGRERRGDIRAWANDQCIAVSGRERIPASVVEQHEAAPAGRWRTPGSRPRAHRSFADDRRPGPCGCPVHGVGVACGRWPRPCARCPGGRGGLDAGAGRGAVGTGAGAGGLGRAAGRARSVRWAVARPVAGAGMVAVQVTSPQPPGSRGGG